MPSQTDIYNGSLRLIGEGDISSPSDGSEQANVLNHIYTVLLKSLLGRALWKFARKTVTLAQSATAPTGGYDYAYPLPEDHIRTVGVWDNDELTGALIYGEEIVDGEDCIVTDATTVYIQYIFYQQDTNLYSANFVRALTELLAADAAVPLAESNTLADKWSKAGNRSLLQAMSSDAMGTFPVRRPRGSWAQRGGSNSGWH